MVEAVELFFTSYASLRLATGGSVSKLQLIVRLVITCYYCEELTLTTGARVD